MLKILNTSKEATDIESLWLPDHVSQIVRWGGSGKKILIRCAYP